MKHSVFWFRRDLRLEDNIALYNSLKNRDNVLPIFIFDDNILNELPKDDPRVYFIYKTLNKINQVLQKKHSSLLILKGKPIEVWTELIKAYNIESVYFNKDYEPYSIKRDKEITTFLQKNKIEVFSFKDQVIFEENEIVKDDDKPYIVFTPYKNKWLKNYTSQNLRPKISFKNFHRENLAFPKLENIGFKPSKISVKNFNLNNLSNYDKTRDYPNLDSTSYLGPHLRFGTISIRQVLSQINPINQSFINELIWREFFMQILYHFPRVVNHNFKAKYDGINWLEDNENFEKWQKGETGYPIVDAGMRQLNKTGYMHNRVRMITAGFLCKHLLIDWRLGESYFAKKLLDYELASNNGNWQWASGTGCDAAPYFRVFNPIEQLKKFDKSKTYVKKWIPDLESNHYPEPIIDHKFARNRALEKYKSEIIKSL